MGRNTNSGNPLIGLAAEYNTMKDTDSDRQTAQALLQNIRLIPSVTLEEAAELCNVSLSTFQRFCKKLGYASFTEFRFKVNDILSNYFYRDDVLPGRTLAPGEKYFDVLSETLENDIRAFKKSFDETVCENIIDAMNAAETIFIHDLAFSTVRLSIQSDLAIAGKKVYFSPNLDQQLLDLNLTDSKSLLLSVIDGEQRTKNLLEHIVTAKNAGAHISVISSVENFRNKSLCDDVIVTGKGSSFTSKFTLCDMTFQYISHTFRNKYIINKIL